MKEFDRLVEIVDILRSEKGCAWDRAQTLDDLRVYLLEETYELIDALCDDNRRAVVEELGDVLLLLVFITRVFKEKQQFSLPEVIAGINEKLVSRHPHVFSSKKLKGPEEIVEYWVKEKAKKKKRRTIAERLPLSAPSLLQALLLWKEQRYFGNTREEEEIINGICGEMQSFSGRKDKEGVLSEVLMEISLLAARHKVDLESGLRRIVRARAGKMIYGEKREDAMTVDEMKKKVARIWKSTRKDIDTMMSEGTRLLKQGEAQLKDASEKGLEKLEQMGNTLRREKLQYELGRLLSGLPKSRWASHSKANSLLKEIKKLDKAIQKTRSR